jgi:hypothetical protein
MSESSIKLIIVSILLLFIIQEILTNFKGIGEPYPALKMPGFSGIHINENRLYEFNSTKIKIYFENENFTELTPKIFFSQAPISHHGELIRKFRSSTENEPRKSLEIFRPILPGYFEARYRSDDEFIHDPETLNWLKIRIKEIEPNKNPIKIEFKRYRDLYNPENLTDRSRELTNITTIEL